MGWMQKTCADCGGELWTWDDWDRIFEYHTYIDQVSNRQRGQ